MGALDGIRILEFGGLGPVPFAAMLLADMGADIIRVDRPGIIAGVPDPITGRGRPRVAADLNDPGEREDVLALTEKADALLEGFRPGVMERLGLGPDVVLGQNPRLVYGRMTGWGQAGPLAHTAGHDLNYIAPTGALAAIGPRDRPVPPLNLVGDYGGGALYLVSGVLAALLSAARTGRGQIVDCAMCDGALSLMSFFFEMAADHQWTPQREANMLDGGAPYYGVYRCADGLDVAVGAIEPHFFADLLEKLDLDGAEFADRDDRACWPHLRQKIADRIATRSRLDWLKRVGVSDACLTPVLRFDEASEHPHLSARQALVTIDGLAQPAPAPRFSETPSSVSAERRKALDLKEAVARWEN